MSFALTTEQVLHKIKWILFKIHTIEIQGEDGKLHPHFELANPA